MIISTSIGVSTKQRGHHEAARKDDQQNTKAAIMSPLPSRSGWSSSARPHQPRAGNRLAGCEQRSRSSPGCSVMGVLRSAPSGEFHIAADIEYLAAPRSSF